MRDIDREHIEIGKMLTTLLREEKDCLISIENGCVYINDKTCNHNLYDGLKEQYLKSMGYEDTELFQMELTPEGYETLCSQADKEGVTIDELVIKILSKHFS